MKTKKARFWWIVLVGICFISPFNDAAAADTPSTPLAWGSNSAGQLGYPNPESDLSPDLVFGLGPGSGVVATAAGGGHSLALRADGSVLAWGGNATGQLGDGTTTGRLTPVQVSGLGPGSGVVAIAAGNAHNLALKFDGTVLAWGRNGFGQLGDGSTIQRLTPVAVSGLGAGSGAVAIAAGFSHSLALKFDGTVLSCGSNANGELGDGTTAGRLVPVQVSGLGPGSGAVAIAAGNAHNLALKFDGTTLAWGNNANGQLGDGTITQRLVPVPVSGLGPGSGVVAIAAGGSHSLGLKSDGTTLAWGGNATGQLGDGTTTGRLTPVQISGLESGSGVIAIAAGGGHSLGLKSDGTVLAWGSNATGQLGDGSFQGKLAPFPISGLRGIVGIFAGAGHNLALRVDDTILAWGSNANGQLGDGTTTTQYTPVPVSGLGPGSGAVAIAAGVSHSLALKFDGTVLAWGNNANGQLGDGTTTQRLTPVPVSGLGPGSGVVAIAAPIGGAHSLALKSNGTVVAWGNNAAGQLGDGTATGRLTPVQVIDPADPSGILSDVFAIAAGGHSLALKFDGAVVAWGNNAAGQLGVGDLTGRLTPVQVSGLESGSGVIAIAAGASHSLALFPLAISGLKEIVDALTLHPNIKGGLLAKLDEAKKALDRGNRRVAENTIAAFLNLVEAQRGKALSDAQADLLVAYANALILLI